MIDLDVARLPAPICLFCGGTEQIEFFEIWSDHNFMLQTCCADLHESLAHEMAADPAWAARLLRSKDVEAITGHRLRRLADDGCCGVILDWQLRIAPVSWLLTQAFVRRHHAHCGAPAARRFGASVWNGSTLLGVVSVGNPVARAFCGRGIVEVNRLCIRRDVPRALAWNGASMLYGWSAREAAARGWNKIITYTRADEDGVSLRAAGWVQEGRVRGRGWHSQRRARANVNAWIDKMRWSRVLQARSYKRPGEPPSQQTGRDSLADVLFSTGPHHQLAL